MRTQRQVVCFICGEEGHLAQDCSMKKTSVNLQFKGEDDESSIYGNALDSFDVTLAKIIDHLKHK